MDLSKMSLDELKKLKKDVDKAITSFEARKRKEALKAIEQVAREHGVELSEIVGATAKRKSTTAKAKSVPKFRNPENPAETWSGRGRQPAWYKAAIAAGKSNDDLAI